MFPAFRSSLSPFDNHSVQDPIYRLLVVLRGRGGNRRGNGWLVSRCGEGLYWDDRECSEIKDTIPFVVLIMFPLTMSKSLPSQRLAPCERSPVSGRHRSARMSAARVTR